MNGENLFDAITNVRDGLVDEAAETQPKKKRVSWQRFGAIAAAVVLAVGIGAGTLGRLGRPEPPGWGPNAPIGDPADADPGSNSSGGAGHDEGTVFMSYAGPVFPLTALDGGGGLAVRRETTYDFSGRDGLRWPYKAAVTDRYILENPTGEDKTVTLLDPFASSLGDLRDEAPALSVDGGALDAGLLVGGYSGGFQTAPGGEDAGLLNLKQLNSWEQYRDLLSDGSYLDGALGGWPDLSGVPVTVDAFTNYWGPERDEANGIPNPTIRAEFDLDYSKTTILAYGFHGASIDRDAGHMLQSFSIPRDFDPENGNPFYLIVLGEDIQNLTTQGYATGGADTTKTVEAGVDVERCVTDLDSALRAAAELMYHGNSWWSEWDRADWPDFELYFGLLKDDLVSYGLIADDPVERYDTGWLEETDVVWMDRVFYLEFSVTVPAGGSVTVEAAQAKEASFDFFCGHTENESVCGYDLVTRLGSGLDFAAQTARTAGTEGLEIVRQNFGFDWKNGVNTVTLDQNEEHYYLAGRKSGKN